MAWICLDRGLYASDLWKYCNLYIQVCSVFFDFSNLLRYLRKENRKSLVVPEIMRTTREWDTAIRCYQAISHDSWRPVKLASHYFLLNHHHPKLTVNSNPQFMIEKIGTVNLHCFNGDLLFYLLGDCYSYWESHPLQPNGLSSSPKVTSLGISRARAARLTRGQ